MGDTDCEMGLKYCDVIGGVKLVWSRERRSTREALFYFSLVGPKIN
jgi:hypothetical protein